MKENKKRTVFYVCFYAEDDFYKDIVSYPSVWSKIDYVSECIKKAGFNICYVCPVIPLQGGFKKREIKIDKNEKHVYFSAYRKPQNRIVNIINVIAQMQQMFFFLIRNYDKGDKILIYHSMFHAKWAWLLKIFGKKYILQVEDVYSALSKEGAKFETEEWRFLESAEAYICVNSLIKNRIKNNAPKVISHGRYAVTKLIENKMSEKCRLVYAGVIEQERCGAFLAAATMRFLPNNYELVILGFGKDKDIEELKSLIDQINCEKSSECMHYLGYMSGEAYLRELQKCSIALSTHMYDESNMKSADYTFPSKILIYMSNGLQVVAQDLECLRTSKIADSIYYYNTATPENVAKAIQSVDLSGPDPRIVIQELGEQFEKEINELLN